MQVEETGRNLSSGKERLEVAKKDFDKMMKEIRPFIKKRDTKTYSTSSEWIVSQEQK